MNPQNSSSLPPIRRMRGWRLYAEDGRRFLDLRLLDGRGFLGAKGRFAGTRAKNGIDLGLLKEAPSRHEERLRKVLSEAFPEAAALRFFRNEERALAALSEARGRSLAREDLYDPLIRGGASPGADAPAALLRFFLERGGEPAAHGFPVRLIPLPCPQPFAPAVLAFAQAEDAASVAGDELAPIQPFTALRAWADFAGLTLPLAGGRRARSGEGAPPYAEKLWARSDRRLSPFFERRGPYLYAKCPETRWPDFRAKALEAGCVLSPEWALPSIVPGEFDDGELQKMAKALEGL